MHVQYPVAYKKARFDEEYAEMQKPYCKQREKMKNKRKIPLPQLN